MQIVKIISTIFFITFLVGCTKQVPSDKVTILEEKKALTEQVLLEKTEEKIINKIPEYILTKNEKEFLKILEADKYASLCGNLDEYLFIKNMPNSEKKSAQLKELFYNYANNLNNSCIDQDSFNSTLKKSKYKKNKQFYEMYNAKLDKESLLNQYSLNNSSIEKILEKYTPKHPDFFKLIEKLDISKLSKIEYNKLRLNIERLKLLKYAGNDNFIQLNVPSFDFSLYEEGKKTRSFGTVVGEKETQTPILSSKLSYFIINPTWNIPDSIAKETIIPNALKDKNYLKRKNIVIRKNYKLDSKKFRFKDIKWKKYLKKHVKYIPYKFIQLPSSTNGMGRVKFMFPNEYAVYMHDTIGTWRFKSNKEKIRFVSHGCVRLEHPISFMKHITTNYTPKSYKSIRKTYLNNEMKTVGLSKKIPVHITYITSSIKKDGKVSFHKDVYGYDKIQKLNFSPYTQTVLLSEKNKNEQIN
ncbi:L,D-transpeptidase family protein [Arcobacter sp. LA11]|uniref:L,D-transpeptidase family protein n=1 Tax=Arcobacter sp. LA11 TaxID=1898176 RepID=UPI00093532EE|nr:L,D-transpeptidase family protein [Arcobacter sp. LA11]